MRDPDTYPPALDHIGNGGVRGDLPVQEVGTVLLVGQEAPSISLGTVKDPDPALDHIGFRGNLQVQEVGTVLLVGNEAHHQERGELKNKNRFSGFEYWNHITLTNRAEGRGP